MRRSRYSAKHKYDWIGHRPSGPTVELTAWLPRARQSSVVAFRPISTGGVQQETDSVVRAAERGVISFYAGYGASCIRMSLAAMFSFISSDK